MVDLDKVGNYAIFSGFENREPSSRVLIEHATRLTSALSGSPLRQRHYDATYFSELLNDM